MVHNQAIMRVKGGEGMNVYVLVRYSGWCEDIKFSVLHAYSDKVQADNECSRLTDKTKKYKKLYMEYKDREIELSLEYNLERFTEKEYAEYSERLNLIEAELGLPAYWKELDITRHDEPETITYRVIETAVD